METSSKNDITPDWLKKIKTRSWEAELLVSGGAFLSLYNLSDQLAELSINALQINFLGSFTGLIAISVRLLSIYFLVHLGMRGFWLSLVFLNKIYPEGAISDRLQYTEPYHESIKNFNLLNRIVALDKLCSLLFSFSFTIFLILIGFALAFGFASIPTFIYFSIFGFGKPHYIYPFIGITTLIAGSLYAFLADFIFHGFIRKSKSIRKFYYPIYQFWNTISLGFIWRPNLQIIYSNAKNKWMTSLLIMLITIIGLLFSGDSDDYLSLLDSRKHQTSQVTINESNYQDKIGNEKWTEATIQSEVITNNYLKIFVPYSFYEDALIDSVKAKEKVFSSLLTININDSLYAPISWIGLRKINNQKGTYTVVDISHLKKGLHQLNIKGTRSNKRTIEIPFWKQ